MSLPPTHYGSQIDMHAELHETMAIRLYCGGGRIDFSIAAMENPTSTEVQK